MQLACVVTGDYGECYINVLISVPASDSAPPLPQC